MKSKKPKGILCPSGIRKGDTVAVIRPAGAIDLQKYEQACQWIREAGFFVATFPGDFQKDYYFAASDETRAKEWIWAFSEPAIRAVLVARAGYGVMRTLALLKPAHLKKFQSKIFVGYSDMTFAHHWHLNRWKHLSFHGPLVGHLTRSRLHHFMRQLEELPDQPSRERWDEVEILQKGKAKGLLAGGNLSLLQTSGPAALPQKPMILAIEDVNEDHYRLDRMIWSLIHAGYSKWVKGLLLGSFHQCGRDAEQFPRQKFLDTCRKLTDGPIWSNAEFGHGLEKQRLLPIGSFVEMSNKQLFYKHALVGSRNS